METNFKVGDVVRLKSGSVKMTIYKINEEYNTASLVWFNELTNKLESNKDVTQKILVKAD